ncbi:MULTISPECIES: serine/threonine-protein kinase [unclassified Streptomyces]|uniref:serine/threonine-protein kinase n=1 Tax=unclassified Streptomyces TaxID=2593676 RepID=UPI0004759AB6|nr:MULTISPECIES: serine/threonine-protein kinase [unclassified Streptomyces]MYX34968.1 PQQ-binding-like beta-propeller repeat protein [Streptomyces sp. SID8377]
MPPVRRTGTDPEAEHPEYAGQYRLEGRLGSGGMGVVHLSRSTSGMRLAVKVVHEEFAKDAEFRARFRQEVTAARLVSGAFTAPVVDADPEAERPWMATLYIPGPTLAAFVRRNGPVAPAQVRYLMAGLAEALRDIHRAGVVHRDLKPSNVLLAADGPKVIDFGISRPSDSELRTETGKLIGTPPFMAPEQFRRPRSVGPAADVFAMASVLVHAATGRSPFDSDSPYIVAYQVVHDEPELTGIPADLLPLIRRCLAKDPDDRPTPDALMTELRTISASYDTQTFSAFDVERLDTEGLIPAQRRAASEESRSAGESPSRRNSGSGGRGMSRIAAVAATSALLIAGGVTAIQVYGGPFGDARHTASTASSVGFQPWSTSLLGGTTENALAGCTYATHFLFCSQRGVNAAKVDPRNGLLQWSVHGDPGVDDVRKSSHPPVLDHGVLRVVTRGGKRLEGLDPADGKSIWALDISAAYGAFYDAADSVLLVGRDGSVTAVDGRTGTERWHKKLHGHSLPVFTTLQGSATAYATEVSGDGKHTLVSSLDPADGKLSGQHRLDGDLDVVGASASGVYLASSDAYSRTDAVLRLDLRDGTTRRFPLAKPLDAAQAVVRDDVVYVLGYGGTLLAVDTRGSGGSEARARSWRLETSVSDGSRPVVVGDRLYLSSSDGRLLAVDTERGVFLGQTKPRLGDGPGNTESPPSPLVADGKVFATAPDGSVFAVDAEDPSRW